MYSYVLSISLCVQVVPEVPEKTEADEFINPGMHITHRLDREAVNTSALTLGGVEGNIQKLVITFLHISATFLTLSSWKTWWGKGKGEGGEEKWRRQTCGTAVREGEVKRTASRGTETFCEWEWRGVLRREEKQPPNNKGTSSHAWTDLDASSFDSP